MNADAPICTICQTRPVKAKKKFLLYGFHVCRKCLYGFANRRQAAFVVDSITWSLLSFLVFGVVGLLAGPSTPGSISFAAVVQSLSFFGYFLFLAKDGFSGQSPGKRLCGVQVVDAQSMEPIGFGVSLVRNLPLLILALPGYLVLMVGFISPSPGIDIAVAACSVFNFLGLLVIASRLVKGARWGDGWAGTKVVLKRHAYRMPFDLRGEACTHCGYNLRGNVSGVCPECGRPVEKPEHQEVDTRS